MDRLSEICWRLVAKSAPTNLRSVFGNSSYQDALSRFEAACYAADNHTNKTVSQDLAQYRLKARQDLNTVVDNLQKVNRAARAQGRPEGEGNRGHFYPLFADKD